MESLLSSKPTTSTQHNSASAGDDNMYRYQRRTQDFTMEKLTGVDSEIFQKGSEA